MAEITMSQIIEKLEKAVEEKSHICEPYYLTEINALIASLKSMQLKQPQIKAIYDLQAPFEEIECALSDSPKNPVGYFIEQSYLRYRWEAIRDKAYAELDSLKKEWNTLSACELIERASEISAKCLIYDVIDDAVISAKQIDTLMTYPNIIEEIYSRSIGLKSVCMESLGSTMEQLITEREEYLDGQKFSPDVIDWIEQYADNEADEELEP